MANLDSRILGTFYYGKEEESLRQACMYKPQKPQLKRKISREEFKELFDVPEELMKDFDMEADDSDYWEAGKTIGKAATILYIAWVKARRKLPDIIMYSIKKRIKKEIANFHF